MINKLDNLRTLKAMIELDSIVWKFDNNTTAEIPEVMKSGFCGALDEAVQALVLKTPPAPSTRNVFDQDKVDNRNRGLIAQIDMMSDAMTRMKKRYDAAVKRVDYTQELSETVKAMCLMSAHTAELARLIER